jgi:hypothetical protein
MIVAPRAHLTARIISTDALFLPLALAYAFLLAHSWQADTLKLILPGTLQEGLSGMSRGMAITAAGPDLHAGAFNKAVCTYIAVMHSSGQRLCKCSSRNVHVFMQVASIRNSSQSWMA